MLLYARIRVCYSKSLTLDHAVSEEGVLKSVVKAVVIIPHGAIYVYSDLSHLA